MATRSKRLAARLETHNKREGQRAKTRVSLLDMDPDSPEFAAGTHRLCLAIANSPQEAEDQAFVDAISVKLFD